MVKEYTGESARQERLVRDAIQAARNGWDESERLELLRREHERGARVIAEQAATAELLSRANFVSKGVCNEVR